MNLTENAENNILTAHYLDEWSMWMDSHPEGLQRITERGSAQKEGADEWKPVSVILLADLVTGEITNEIPEKFQKVLHSDRIPLHATRADEHEGQEDSDQNPGAHEHLSVQIQITDLPVHVMTHFQFGEREWKGQQSHGCSEECSVSAVEDVLKNQGGLVKKKSQEGRQQIELGKLG